MGPEFSSPPATPIDLASPGAIGGTTPAAGAFTALTAQSLGLTGQSVSGSASTNLVDLAATWNTTGAPVAIKANITNTASGAGARLMDLQTGGTTRASVDTAGLTYAARGFRSPALGGTSADLMLGRSDEATGISSRGAGQLNFWTSGNLRAGFTAGGALELTSIGFTGSSHGAGTADVLVTRAAAGVMSVSTGNLRLPNMPTSSVGLSAGDLWNDGGTVKIV